MNIRTHGFSPTPPTLSLDILPKQAPPRLRRAAAATALSARIHGPGADAAQVAALRIVAEGVLARATGPAHLLLVALVQLPGPAAAALGAASARQRGAVRRGGVHAGGAAVRGGFAQAELLFLFVAVAVVGLVTDARVPGLVRVERAPAGGAAGRRRASSHAGLFVGAGRVPAVLVAAVPERGHLVVDPADDAARGGRGEGAGRAGAGARAAREGVERRWGQAEAFGADARVGDPGAAADDEQEEEDQEEDADAGHGGGGVVGAKLLLSVVGVADRKDGV